MPGWFPGTWSWELLSLWKTSESSRHLVAFRWYLRCQVDDDSSSVKSQCAASLSHCSSLGHGKQWGKHDRPSGEARLLRARIGWTQSLCIGSAATSCSIFLFRKQGGSRVLGCLCPMVIECWKQQHHPVEGSGARTGVWRWGTVLAPLPKALTRPALVSHICFLRLLKQAVVGWKL